MNTPTHARRFHCFASHCASFVDQALGLPHPTCFESVTARHPVRELHFGGDRAGWPVYVSWFQGGGRVLHSPPRGGVMFSKPCSPNQVMWGASHPQCLCTASQGPVHTGCGAPPTRARKLWNTLWSMGVFTLLASNIQGCKCAYASCVNGALVFLIQNAQG